MKGVHPAVKPGGTLAKIDASAAGIHEDPEGYVTGAVMSDERVMRSRWIVCTSLLYGLLPVNRTGHNTIKVPQKLNKKECLFYLYQGGKQFSTPKSSNIFIHHEENKLSQLRLFTVFLAGYVSTVPEAVCTFVSASL